MANNPCPMCGHDNPAGMQFCRSCGARLLDAPPVVTPPPAPPKFVDDVPSPKVRTPSPGRGRTIALVVLAIVVIGVGIAAWLSMRPGDAFDRLTGEKNSAQSQLAETRALTTEKDSVMAELLATTSLISEVSQAITAVQNGRNAPMLEESGHPMTARQARAFLLPKIDSLRVRLNTAETQLAASLDRVHQMPTSEQFRAQIAEYERTIASVKKLVATQQDQLNDLGTQLADLRAENTRLLETQGQLVTSQHALQDSMIGLKEDENTVYWVAGSKSSLLELGVIVEEGSSKVLVFGKGKSMAPARTLTASDFTPVNKRQTTTILLPKATTRYRILSRQDLAGLKNVIDKNGHVRGSIEISDPAAFWAPSPYLILVEDN